MGNCLSRPTSRRERQVQARLSGSHQLLESSSISTVNKKGDSTHQILLTIEEDNSIRLSKLNRDSYANSYNNIINNEGYNVILSCHDKLVTAIATDYLIIAGDLLTHGFISEEVFAKMLLPSSTPNEKATVLVTAMRERIKLAPQHFSELVTLFSEHTSTKCVVSLLQSTHQGKVRHKCTSACA